jgi:predicted alpha/beta superfamily hydrolase
MEGIELIPEFPSKAEGFSRSLRVFTPHQYAGAAPGSFGVLVMHDGQNVLEHPASARWPTWSANHALQRLMDEGRIGNWLIVAVDHGLGRFEDFSPWPEPRAGVHGQADTYLRFVTEELLPWARSRYRLRAGPQYTATSGSSLGGLVSLYFGLKRPDVFGRVAALSPSVMWSEDGLFRHWTEHTRRWTKLYLDAGDPELYERPEMTMKYGQSVAAFHQHLLSLGYAHHEVRCVLEPGAPHDEAAWARRLPGALAFALEPWA